MLGGARLGRGREQNCDDYPAPTSITPADLVSGFAQPKILGACRTPFAVKGGGHATNPGFSSTSGVEVALARFNSTKVNAYDGTVEIGPGLNRDQVYETWSESRWWACTRRWCCRVDNWWR